MMNGSNRTVVLSLACFLSALVAATATPASPARAATFTVTKTADTNDGVCDTDCSLREAIVAANASPGADTVVVPAGTYSLTLLGSGEDSAASGDLDILDDVAIQGAGALTTIVDAAPLAAGGAADRVFHIPFSGHAGAVSISGLTIQGGGGVNAGAGVDNDSLHTSLTITDCTIQKNSVALDGGGISTAGPLVVDRSTLTLNSAGTGGGALIAGAFFEETSATITNSTITANHSGDFCGGLWWFGQLTLVSSTVSGDTQSRFGDLYTFDGGATVQNTLIDGSCTAAIGSQGGNLESPGDTCSFHQASDQAGVADPMIGALASNTGDTPTLALLPGSPALDAAVTATCPATDQRGVPRPQGAACDIGAFERRPGCVASIATRGRDGRLASFDLGQLAAITTPLALAGIGWLRRHRQRRAVS